MRFFKYLILIILSLFSVSTFADYYSAGSGQHSTALAACNALYGTSVIFEADSNSDMPDGSVYVGVCRRKSDQSILNGVYLFKEKPKCPSKGYPSYYYFSSGGKVPTRTCTQMPGGQYCVFEAGSNPIILNHENDRQSVTLYSVSENAVSSCTPLFDNQCDKTDPYGSCYQPPNDGCTRQKDGSIICPENAKPPTPEEQCKGADYCNRPPNGCPQGYVSGSFNGQALCVKSSPSTGGPTTGDGDGSGSGGDGDGSGSGGDGSGSGSGGDGSGSGSGGDGSGSGSGGDGSGSGSGGDGSGSGSGSDLSGVIGAINNAKNAITAAVNSVSTKIDTLLKGQKETNEKLNNIDQNGKQTNEKLDHLNGTAEESKGILQNIYDWLTEKPDESAAQENMPFHELSVGDLNTGLFNLTGSCPAPYTFNAIGHTFTFDISQLCEVLSIIGILISCIACIHGIAILAENT